MKNAIKKMALNNAKYDRFHVSLIFQKTDACFAIPILREKCFWSKAAWEIETENHHFFVFRVKTRTNDIRGFFRELDIFYKKLRGKSLVFKIEGIGYWADNGGVTTDG
jgi:spore coat polysaccharide biosynthesis protein SpsF (cytidylyltransferase family)